METFPTVTHVAVTVTDLDVSVPWYTSLFGAAPVLDEDTGPFRHVVYAIGGSMLFGLHFFPDSVPQPDFDPRRRGLDHVAFACQDRDELKRWQDRLDELRSRTATSSTPTTGRACPSRTPTGWHWSSSLPRQVEAAPAYGRAVPVLGAYSVCPPR